MSDILRTYPVTEVAAWYRRLANRIGQERVNGQEPLSAQFLRHYVDNRDPDSTYSPAPPSYLTNNSLVLEALRYHRRVFLTEEKARITGRSDVWAGVIPRLQGRAGFTAWVPGQPLKMEYQSLVEMPLRFQVTGTREEKDLLTSLRGFQLKSEVSVRGSSPPNSTRVKIEFVDWSCRVLDRYDFNYDEYFTVPNPDYGSDRPGAIAPKEQSIRVYHRNAQRLERAGFAAPYNLDMQWQLSELTIKGAAEVDRNRNLGN